MLNAERVKNGSVDDNLIGGFCLNLIFDLFSRLHSANYISQPQRDFIAKDPPVATSNLMASAASCTSRVEKANFFFCDDERCPLRLYFWRICGGYYQDIPTVRNRILSGTTPRIVNTTAPTSVFPCITSTVLLPNTSLDDGT